LSPIFKSSNFDWGFDVTDFYSIQPQLGTWDDLDKIIRKAYAKGMHVLLDFPINHVSKDHPWFIESASSRTNLKADWFVWSDQPDGTPAAALVGGSDWEYSPVRGQYYYHFFHKEMPDLHYDNPDVKNAIFDAIRYVYSLGVDGLRVDVPTTIFQNIPFSNPVVEGLGGDMTRNHVIFSEIRAIDPSKLLIAENVLEVLGVLTGMPNFFVDFLISMSPWEFQLNQDFSYIYYSDPAGGREKVRPAMQTVSQRKS
jgi:glycosidase